MRLGLAGELPTTSAGDEDVDEEDIDDVYDGGPPSVMGGEDVGIDDDERQWLLRRNSHVKVYGQDGGGGDGDNDVVDDLRTARPLARRHAEAEAAQIWNELETDNSGRRFGPSAAAAAAAAAAASAAAAAAAASFRSAFRRRASTNTHSYLFSKQAAPITTHGDAPSTHHHLHRNDDYGGDDNDGIDDVERGDADAADSGGGGVALVADEATSLLRGKHNRNRDYSHNCYSHNYTRADSRSRSRRVRSSTTHLAYESAYGGRKRGGGTGGMRRPRTMSGPRLTTHTHTTTTTATTTTTTTVGGAASPNDDKKGYWWRWWRMSWWKQRDEG